LLNRKILESENSIADMAHHQIGPHQVILRNPDHKRERRRRKRRSRPSSFVEMTRMPKRKGKNDGKQIIAKRGFPLSCLERE
jgi:hypothetical protein